MLRRTKIILIVMAVIVYVMVPFGSIVDSLLFTQGYKDTTPYLLVNVWEASLFMMGVYTGITLMRMDMKKHA